MWLHSVAPDSDVLPSGLENADSDTDQLSLALDRDPLMERLVRALLPEEEACRMLHGFYVDARHPVKSAPSGGWHVLFGMDRVGWFV